MEIIYRANDGKEFSSKSECEKYELRGGIENNFKFLSSIRFYFKPEDEEMACIENGTFSTPIELKYAHNMGEFLNNYKNASAIYIPNYEVLNAFKKWFDSCPDVDETGDFEVGINFWALNGDGSYWVDQDEYRSFLLKQIEELDKWVNRNLSKEIR